ncbi:hypothetical protein QQS21_006920 [Conoideocrella luteorostrata]|uniref:Thioesterase family protein n=1 Tax=Conoideocrella luteorostrata TaxID=1105319 RepID=A0AAJ0CPG5_9HYPO|nr:hypothetical protein QQS21_006920 [Conoideocrella luteorostrata]
MTSLLHEHINLKKTSANTYNVSWHRDWALGATLLGSYIAAQIHLTASAHLTTDPSLQIRNQPDILHLYIEFLRPCEHSESDITITALKIGSVTSTLQLQLSQGGKVKVIALATSTNFDQTIGPSASTDWRLLPPPQPTPDFNRIISYQPEANWLPARLEDSVVPGLGRINVLYPRVGFPTNGVCDAWYSWVNEGMDDTKLAFMTDVMPSMSDTLMRNDGLYDVHAWHKQIQQWAEKNPGIPATITNSTTKALQATTFVISMTLDIEFKRRLPKEKKQWTFSRAATKMLQDGRMDVEITICNEDMELLCTARESPAIAPSAIFLDFRALASKPAERQRFCVLSRNSQTDATDASPLTQIAFSLHQRDQNESPLYPRHPRRTFTIDPETTEAAEEHVAAQLTSSPPSSLEHSAYSILPPTSGGRGSSQAGRNEHPPIAPDVRVRIAATLASFKGKRGSPSSFITARDVPSFSAKSAPEDAIQLAPRTQSSYGPAQGTPPSLELSSLLRPLGDSARSRAGGDD